MILVFDTETSNLPQKNLPLDHPAQARIVQIAALLLDETFKERASFCSLIKPDGWIIQPGAQGAHGITQAECEKYGVEVEYVLDTFELFLLKSSVRVAHNAKFDCDLLSIEASLDISHAALHNFNNKYCTMELMTSHCKLVRADGRSKWPKLQEAYKFVTSQEFAGAHGALADCKATSTVFKWLVDNKHVSISHAPAH